LGEPLSQLGIRLSWRGPWLRQGERNRPARGFPAGVHHNPVPESLKLFPFGAVRRTSHYRFVTGAGVWDSGSLHRSHSLVVARSLYSLGGYGFGGGTRCRVAWGGQCMGVGRPGFRMGGVGGVTGKVPWGSGGLSRVAEWLPGRCQGHSLQVGYRTLRHYAGAIFLNALAASPERREGRVLAVDACQGCGRGGGRDYI
jgi:hypothetical protein